VRWWEVELADRIPAVPPTPGATSRRRLLILVRFHGCPVGQVPLTVGPEGLSADELARVVWTEVSAAVLHRRHDGSAVPLALGSAGLEEPVEPAFLRRRHALLDSPPLITVMIATRDRTESLIRCLESVYRLAYPRFEVVVVDSAPSTTSTREAVETFRGRPGAEAVRYVHEERPGLALAHNRGLAAARGAWVAITDDDVVVDPQWLTGLAEAAARADGIACVTGLILPAELAAPAQELLEEFGGFSRGFEPRLVDVGPNRPSDPLFPLAVGRLGSGANMAFDVEVLRRLGGFDPATGVGTPARGGDDLFGFLRVLAAGYSLAYEPGALVWHYHRPDYASLRRQARGYGVGLGAYLTSVAMHEPQLLPQMVCCVRPGIRHLVSRTSPKNARKQAGYPRELERLERLGVLQGPFAYAISRWQRRSRVAA
jgi:GT2 family glycosyltransferase